MKVQVFSDIHFEAYQDPKLIWKFVTPQAPIAIVAGDIDAHKFEDTISEIATRFETVIAVYGNHEWYRKDITWRPDFTRIPQNVQILDRTCFVKNKVLFIGATLWTDFKNQDWFVMHNAKDRINDFGVIRNGAGRFTPNAAWETHIKDKAFIKTVLNTLPYAVYKPEKVCVVTHFMPSYNCVHPQYRTPHDELLNQYFVGNCDDLLAMDNIDCWFCGHTHSQFDEVVGNTRVVINPLGYPNERYGDNSYTDKVVEL